MATDVKTNSLKAWILAARPKTLTGAAAPVLVGAAMAWACQTILHQDLFSVHWIIPSVICLLFALAMQIDANFINDYFDWKKGADSEERLGPERACSKGWITPGAMKTGLVVTTLVSVFLGLPLVYYGGWWMIAVGALCVLGAFLYTTKLSYRGWGDVMVVLFFGLVPVFFTWFVSTCSPPKSMYYPAIIAGLAVGFITDNLLLVNNYRDRELDKKNGKKTLVVRLGSRASEWLYLINGCLAIIGAMIVGGWLNNILKSSAALKGWAAFPFYLVVPLLFLPILYSSHRKMVRINKGRQLNESLGEAARNILIFSVLFVVVIIISVLSVCYSH